MAKRVQYERKAAPNKYHNRYGEFMLFLAAVTGLSFDQINAKIDELAAKDPSAGCWPSPPEPQASEIVGD